MRYYRCAITLIVLIAMSFATASGGVFAQSNVAQLDLAQQVFPSVRAYRLSDGVFNKADIARIYIVAPQPGANAARLKEVVLLVAREFVANRLLSSESFDIIYGDGSSIAAGDMVVQLADGNTATRQAEGYTIEITDKIIVKANSSNGAMYALRTIMQYLFKQGAMPKGTIVDYPTVAERALHIDIGRKYFTANWLKDIIKEMSFCKLNALQLHFSENQGFRIACDTYPEIVSKRHLTKAEVREIIELARRYGVSIIPSFDSPGHLRAVLAKYKPYQLVDRWGKRQKRALDINNDEARQFIKNILSEYAELFADSKYFHIGGDEFIDFNDFDDYPSLAEFGQKRVAEGVTANGLDGYMAYINEMADHVKALGFTPRIWNDGVYRRNMTAHIALNDDIQINYWSRWDNNIATVDELFAKGHQLINTSEMMYYVLADGVADVPEYDLKVIYNSWHAGVFQGHNDGTQTYQTPHSNILGACYAIWCDQPNIQSEAEVAKGIYYPLRAMAEKSWAGQRQAGTVQAFKGLLDELAKVELDSDTVLVGQVKTIKSDFRSAAPALKTEKDRQLPFVVDVFKKIINYLLNGQ